MNENECLVWHDQLDDLYYAYISTIRMHVMVNQKFTNQNEFLVWYDHSSYPGSIMMRKKGLKNSCWHPLRSQETSSDQWVFMYYTFIEVDN